MRKHGVVLLLLSAIFLTACGSGNEANANQADYDQTKKMVVDILKTDEGKNALKDIMNDEEMKQQLIMDQEAVKTTIEQTLTSEKGSEFWKKSFQDPKFAEAVAKSMKKQNEQLLKDLMKDPEYQGMVMDILKDPVFQQDLAQALKSKEFREHLQTVITDTLESPLYKAKIQELLLKAAKETDKKDKGEEKGGGQDQDQGEDQGGGGE